MIKVWEWVKGKAGYVYALIFMGLALDVTVRRGESAWWWAYYGAFVVFFIWLYQSRSGPVHRRRQRAESIRRAIYGRTGGVATTFEEGELKALSLTKAGLEPMPTVGEPDHLPVPMSECPACIAWEQKHGVAPRGSK